ncbi:hypothetical protein ES707_09340 [subsurface metagenome]
MALNAACVVAAPGWPETSLRARLSCVPLMLSSVSKPAGGVAPLSTALLMPPATLVWLPLVPAGSSILPGSSTR